MRSFLPVSVILTGLALAACAGDAGEQPEPADASAEGDVEVPLHLLRGLPVMPGSAVLSTNGTSNTVEVVTRSVVPPTGVATWYRRALIDAGWEMLGDAVQSNGAVSLHARASDGRPVWLMVRPADDESGTVVSVIVAETRE